ncbi:hypothetical protein BGW38_004484 [Lunasporangiospora selenospora]|uniref:Uncharacterized protein n=1 Tax=Lunasporangiospora selenospora TaxID=979761 RepID=A0A9P6G297_9FUNG|nr:hypothetical protein BGW38_004484 [Lunasporangiospora selenospora]
MSASSLAKFITQIKVSMAPFSPASKTSKMVTKDAIAANPALKVVTESHADVDKAPTLFVAYKDGKTLNLETGDMKINDVLRQVGKHARKLQEKEDASA